MSIMTWTSRAKCKDCIYLYRIAFTSGKKVRHLCTNDKSDYYLKIRTLNDLVCDKWKLS